jgi:hypothetical protein
MPFLLSVGCRSICIFVSFDKQVKNIDLIFTPNTLACLLELLLILRHIRKCKRCLFFVKWLHLALEDTFS